MKETPIVIIGSSIAGLAMAVCLQKQGLDYTIIEKEAQVATPWRNHYQRLHLHTNKSQSGLPYKKFGRSMPRYPSRQQVIDYLEDYRTSFNIQPVFNAEALSVKKEGDKWITTTTHGVFASQYVIVATGAFGKPKQVSIPGMETFPGPVIHSYGYKTGKDFTGKNVLVIGFGNSACEIAIDLYEQGAKPCMSVRSPVNAVPRDIAGIPILQLSIVMSILPPRVADAINAPLIRLLTGDIRKLGLHQLPYGPLTQIQKDGTAPVLDIGTLKLIRQGHIKIYGAIDHIEQQTVHFTDGKKMNADAIVAAIGYYRDYANIIEVDKNRFEDLAVSASRQKHFGEEGLYFCGFWIAPTGQIREIGRDALQIAKHIAQKEISRK